MKSKIVKIIVLAVAIGIFFPNTVGASTKETVEKKSYMQGLYTCYTLKMGGSRDHYKGDNRYNDNGTDLYKKRDGEWKVNNWYQIDDEIEANSNTGFSYRKFFPNEPAANKVNLPNGWTPESGDSKTNCAHLVNGGHDGFTDTIFDRLGKPSAKFEKSSDENTVKTVMNSMGYTSSTSTTATDGTQCLKIAYHWKKTLFNSSHEERDSGEEGDAETQCLNFTIEDGKISTYDKDYDNSASWDGYLRLDINGGNLGIIVQPSGKYMYSNEVSDGNAYFIHEFADGPHYNYDADYDFDTLKTKFQAKLNDWMNESDDGLGIWAYRCGNKYKSHQDKCEPVDGFDSKNYYIFITSATAKSEAVASTASVWKLSDHNAGANAAMTYLGNSTIGTTRTGTSVTKSEQVVLYQHYISDIANGVVTCGLSSAPSDDAKKVTWFESTDSKKTDCYVYPYTKGSTKYSLLDSDGYFLLDGSIEDVIDTLTSVANGLTKLTGVDGVISSGDTGKNKDLVDSDKEEAPPDCYSNSGSLGWVLCPIIEGGGKAIASIYDNYVTPFLVLDAGLFKSGEGTTYSAWSQFQGYANIAFIAVFLVVIFSQITGYGIDNYGIKKILPKLIIAAILINLSYIICQVAIDIANIIGYGVKGIFDGVGKIDMSELTIAEAPGAKNAFTASAILVVLVGLLVTPAILANGWGILVPVFLAIIGIAIGIISLFVILAIRKALAIVLVVISPLAFVAYMLPNTKKIFDRWLTSFKATLLAFPICSVMVFGGQAVARIMLSVAGTTKLPSAMALSAAAMSIAPVFLIPSVLKKSMGAISGMIDRVSHGVNRHARGRVAGSGIAHDLQRRGQMQRAGVKVGKDGKVQLTRRGRIQNALPRTAASRQRLDAIRADAVKSMGATAAAGSYMGDKGLDKMNAIYSSAQAAQSKQRVSDLEAMINTGDEANNISALQGHLTEAINSGDVDAVKAYQNVLTSKGEAGREAVRDAMIASGSNASVDGIKAYSQNIMENHQAAYKAKNRSVYDFAKAGQEKGVATMSNSINTAKLTGDQMAGMDDKAFERLQQQPVDDNMRAAAYAALNSEGINSMEQGRRTALEQMASGYQPAGNNAPSGAEEAPTPAETVSGSPSTEEAPAPAETVSSSPSGGDATVTDGNKRKTKKEREINAYLFGLTAEEKSKLFYNNPKQPGESNEDYMHRVACDYRDGKAKVG